MSDTALSLASAKGHVATMEQLLAKGAGVNEGGALSGSALILACSHGHWDAAALLIRRGAEITAKKQVQKAYWGLEIWAGVEIVVKKQFIIGPF